MKKLFSILLVYLLSAEVLFAGTTSTPRPTGGFDLPEGAPLTFLVIREIIRLVYMFLIYVASVAIVFTFLIAGIMWLRAGGNDDKVKKAKGIFKGGVIGGLIILGVGVIVRTIEAIVLGDFFY